MTTLQKIRYDLKGQKRSLDLSGVDLITGPNGSGKSTALIAIVAGLRGLAQSAGDLEKPYIGPERTGSVQLVFDAGTIDRDLSQGQAAKASQKATYDAERIAGKHIVRWDLADFANGPDSGREKLLRSICGSIQAADLELPQNPLLPELLRSHPIQGDAGTWLELALAGVAGVYKDANAAQKTASEGAKAAGEAAEQAAPPGTLSAAKEERDRLAVEVADLRARQQTAAREAAAAQRAEAERQRAAARHAEAEKERDALAMQLQQPAPDLAGLKATLEAAEAALQQAILANRTAQSRAAQGDAPHKVLAKLEGAKAALEGKIAALQAQLGITCPHCGAADPLGMGATYDAARAAMAGLELDLEDARLEVELADRRAAKLGEAYEAASKAELAARDAYRVATGVAAQRGHIEARRAALDAELVRLAAAIQGEAVQVGGFDSQALLEGLEEQLKAATALLDQHTRAAERGRLHQEAIQKREAAKARFEAVTELGKALRVLQGEVAAKAWGPLQAAANDLLQAMGSRFRASFRSAADFGATDARREGAYVSFWALSDAERATVGAALALAMVRLSGSPWPALVLDGMERMDPDSMEGFLRGVVAAKKAGWLSNFIGVVVESEDNGSTDDIRCHWMGASNGL